jgi:predicted Zn-dependent protease
MYEPKNYIDQIVEYILKNLKKGYTLDSLKYSLITQGYSRISVEDAIKIANQKLAQTIPPIKEKPQIIYKHITHDNKEIHLAPKKTSNLKRFFNWLKN